MSDNHIGKMTLQDVCDMYLGHLEEEKKESGQTTHMYIVGIRQNNGTYAHMLMPVLDSSMFEMKDEMCRKVGLKLGTDHALGKFESIEFFGMASEACMSTGTPGRPPTGEPSKDPNRREVLVTVASDGSSYCSKFKEIASAWVDGAIVRTFVEPDFGGNLAAELDKDGGPRRATEPDTQKAKSIEIFYEAFNAVQEKIDGGGMEPQYVELVRSIKKTNSQKKQSYDKFKENSDEDFRVVTAEEYDGDR